MRFINLFLCDGGTMMIAEGQEDIILDAMEDGNGTCLLNFHHGPQVTILCRQIQGFSISTPESRAEFHRISEALHDELEEDSTPPWK